MLSFQVYEPLVRGGNHLDDGLLAHASTLQVVNTAFGRFWELTLRIEGGHSQIDDWIADGTARHVELYNHGTAEIWEGFVNTVDANIGSLTISIGPVLEMANKVKCVYSYVDTSITPPAVGMRDFTSWYEDATSQEQYGTIEKVISVGGASPTNAIQIAQTALADRKNPPRREVDNLESVVRPSATIRCLGYIHWTRLYTYTSVNTGDETASTKLQNIINADPNSFLSTDFTGVETNATNVRAWEDEYRTAWNLIKGLASLGDSSYDRWLIGFGKDRIPTYAALPSSVKYQRSLSAPRQQVETYKVGSGVMPWDVDVGEWCFYTDLLIGRPQPNERRLDPRFLFVEQTAYTMPWGLTLEGGTAARLDQLLAQLGLAGASA